MGTQGKRQQPWEKKTEKEPFKYTEEYIQDVLNGFFAPNSVKYNIDGLYVFDWESDKLLETKSGYIYEFEIKISKSDFKNDFKHKKDKHIILENKPDGDKYLPRYYEAIKRAGESFHKYADENPYYLATNHKRPNYFYYAVPTGLIGENEVPDYAGLIYVNEYDGIVVVKKAPCLHKEKYSDEQLNLGEKFYYNMVTWKNRAKKNEKKTKEVENKLLLELTARGHEKTYEELQEELNKTKWELDIERRNAVRYSKMWIEDSNFNKTFRRILYKEFPDTDWRAIDEKAYQKYRDTYLKERRDDPDSLNVNAPTALE